MSLALGLTKVNKIDTVLDILVGGRDTNRISLKVNCKS